MTALSDFSMPRACISCDHFQPIGKRRDSNMPDNRYVDGGGSWPYGLCSVSGAKVWGTEICASFLPDDLIQLIEVDDQARQRPFEVRQDGMFPIDAGNR